MDKWDVRFMQLAENVATWSSCINRHVGAIIVKDKHIIATGYNGAPAGVSSCFERGECMRKKLSIASGERAELCYATHAEMNALVQAAKLGISVKGATLYTTLQPCSICLRLCINAGIKRIVYMQDYTDQFTMKLVAESGIIFEKY